MRGLKSLLPVVFLLLAAACSVDIPSHVIPEDKMERILYDYHVAQGMAEAQGGDMETNRYLYVQKVFEKYHVTEAEFDTSMVWYSGHASHLKDMYVRIEARLDRTSHEAGLNIPEEDKFARFTAEGDTANIWQGNEMLFIHGTREDNIHTLIIPADTAFQKGDYFMLRFGNRFITADNQREAFVLLQIKYDNDSVVGATSMIGGNYDLTLTIPDTAVLADRDIKSLSCTFYYAFDENKDDAFRLWVISKPVLLRYHAQAATDSLPEVPADTLEADTAQQPEKPAGGERMSPETFRDNQQVERKINVIEKRKYALPANGATRKRVMK